MEKIINESFRVAMNTTRDGEYMDNLDRTIDMRSMLFDTLRKMASDPLVRETRDQPRDAIKVISRFFDTFSDKARGSGIDGGTSRRDLEDLYFRECEFFVERLNEAVSRGRDNRNGGWGQNQNQNRNRNRNRNRNHSQYDNYDRDRDPDGWSGDDWGGNNNDWGNDRSDSSGFRSSKEKHFTERDDGGSKNRENNMSREQDEIFGKTKGDRNRNRDDYDRDNRNRDDHDDYDRDNRNRNDRDNRDETPAPAAPAPETHLNSGKIKLLADAAIWSSPSIRSGVAQTIADGAVAIGSNVCIMHTITSIWIPNESSTDFVTNVARLSSFAELVDSIESTLPLKSGLASYLNRILTDALVDAFEGDLQGLLRSTEGLDFLSDVNELSSMIASEDSTQIIKSRWDAFEKNTMHQLLPPLIEVQVPVKGGASGTTTTESTFEHIGTDLIKAARDKATIVPVARTVVSLPFDSKLVNLGLVDEIAAPLMFELCSVVMASKARDVLLVTRDMKVFKLSKASRAKHEPGALRISEFKEM